MTQTPTLTPEPAEAIEFGVPLSGILPNASRLEYTFTGEAGQTVSVSTGHIIPMTGFTIGLIAPDGEILAEGNVTRLGPVTLPVSNTYRVMIESTMGQFSYTLLLSEE